MATTAVSLSVPAAADDSMEMSSPGNHNIDEDIDFDDYEPATHVNDDDRMTDDGEQIRPGTATDDVMVDDMQEGEQPVVQEEVMQDSPSHEQQLEDEDLIDYSDDELQDEIVEDAGEADIAEQPSAAAPAIELPDGGVDGENIQVPGDSALEQPTEDAHVATTLPEADLAPLSAEEDVTVPQDVADTNDLFAGGDDQIKPATVAPHGEDIEGHEEEHETSLQEQLTTGDAQISKPVISLDTSAQPTTDGPATPTDTGLHAMTVRFGDLQFPLFKSRNQTDGLLKNDNLASLSLGELIQNCRQRLATKTGETLSDDQDLVLAFDQLGLTLVEDSRAAFECSLDEVLDVYLQLHRNDEIEDIPPFSLNLSLQLKFTSSISVLKQAAAGGDGMSSFGFHHHGDEQVDEYDEQGQHVGEDGQEEYHEDFEEDETAEGQRQEEAAHAEGSIPEQQQADTNDYYGEHQAQQADYPEQEDYYQENEEYQEDPGEDQYYEENQDEATQLLDEHALEGERQLEESTDIGYNGPADHAAAVDEPLQKYAEATAEEEKATSAATSATFEGEDGQDTTGEYTEEDLIDWDDDSDLTSNPSEQAVANGADSSTLSQHDVAEEQVTAPHAISQAQGDFEQAPLHTAPDMNGQHAAESAHSEIDTQNLGSEDFLGDFDEQQDYKGQTEHQLSYEATANADQETYGEEDGEADVYGQQQEHINHADYQPGEEDEAFQTAYELFDGADHEHRHEQDADNNDADETTLVASATNGEQHGDTEDFIDFDFDEEIAAEEKAKKPDAAAPAGSHTPLAKRSFEDLTGDDEIDFESPEPKKARAS